MLEMILQNFQKNNNIINVAANEEFMRFKNYVYHALSIQRRFLIIHESYIDNFQIMMIDNDEFFMILYCYLSLIKEISFIHHADIFTL